jgi:hypothetical protein
LLTPALAAQLHLDPGPQFDIAEGDRIVILTRDGNLFDLGGMKALPHPAPLNLRAIAVSGGVIIGIRADRLGYYADGALRERLTLPAREMSLAAGSGGRLYLYGQRGADGIIYLLDDGKVAEIAQITKGRVAAVAAIGDRIFFAVDNAIYTVEKGQRAALLFLAPAKGAIRSLAVDTKSGVLYFSSARSVYAMRAGMAVAILRGLEGYLRYSRDALFVLDPAQKRLVKMTGLEKLAIGQSPAAKPSGTGGGFKE